MSKKYVLPKKFCGNQTECSDRKGVYSCLDSLNKGRVPICYYEESQISVNSYEDYKKETHRELQIQREIAGEDGVCRYFEPTLRIKRKFKDKLEGKVVG